jgi:hypothetical protein
MLLSGLCAETQKFAQNTADQPNDVMTPILHVRELQRYHTRSTDARSPTHSRISLSMIPDNDAARLAEPWCLKYRIKYR